MTIIPFSPAVKGLVINDDGRYLLLRRSVASHHDAGRWDLPGGKSDPGETLDETLRREAFEETGLSIEVNAFLSTGEWALPYVHVILLLFEAQTASSIVTLSSEHDKYVWAAQNEILKYDIPQYIFDALEKILT